MASSSADLPDLLCLILDLNPIAWALSAVSDESHDSLSLEQAIEQVLIFCNALLALRHENELAVFAAGLGKSCLLFSSQLTPLTTTSSASATTSRDSNTYQQFSMVDSRIAEGIKSVMGELPDELEGKGQVGLVGALAMALCHINRLNALSTTSSSLSKPKPRIAIISVSEDTASQYVPIMNCIFSAQKSSIPIDVCKVYGPDAVFLQQACFLTSGSYYKIERRAGLLQYLMMTFLAGPSARRYLTQPTQDQVDLRAACFCHRRIIDIGYVCSVCLSIFCAALPVCTTCRTKFPMATLKRLGFGSKAPPPKSKSNKRKAGASAAVEGAGKGVQSGADVV